MIENELKFIITKEQYYKAQDRIKWDEIIEQVNYYYTDNENENITIRVREKRDKYYLQVKIPLSEDKGIHIKKEFTKEIFDIPPIILGTELSELTGEKINNASYIGKLKTTRLRKKINQAELCLDKNEYLGITDYEVEIEYLDVKSREECLAQIQLCALSLENTKVSGKYTRFKQARKRIEE